MRDDQIEIRLAICGAKHSGKSGKRFNIFDVKMILMLIYVFSDEISK